MLRAGAQLYILYYWRLLGKYPARGERRREGDRGGISREIKEEEKEGIEGRAKRNDGVTKTKK